jgi:hypothetical protein
MGGELPWPQVPVGNKDHTDAAVVIIGAGISGKFTNRYRATLQMSCFANV